MVGVTRLQGVGWNDFNGRSCQDADPYVRKTATMCVAKLYDINPELVEDQENREHNHEGGRMADKGLLFGFGSNRKALGSTGFGIFIHFIHFILPIVFLKRKSLSYALFASLGCLSLETVWLMQGFLEILRDMLGDANPLGDPRGTGHLKGKELKRLLYKLIDLYAVMLCQ